MPLAVNDLLHGRYRILGELGRGGMGAVYHAHDDNLGVEVAIKENLVSTPDFEKQFKREALLLAGLRHPHLPRVTDHFVLPGQGQYLVMDFIPGVDAKHTLDAQPGPLPEAEVVRWALEILDALDYLHNRPQPIIHRDIKPGNIKITPEGRAVLVDFGLAKEADAAGQNTATGARALTPGFSPPEQYGTGRTNPRTDIYALGATLYTLLTHQPPPDSMGLLLGHKQRRPLRELNPKVSPAVAAVIERALALKPEERFASAAEFAAALSPAALAQGNQATVVKALPPTPPAKPTAARPPWGLWLGLVGFAGVVLLSLGLWNSGVLTPPPPTATVTATTAPSATAIVMVTPSASPTLAATATPTFSPTPTETPAPTATPTATLTPTPTETPTATPAFGGGRGQLAFVSDRSGVPQIYLMDAADGGNVSQLTTLPAGACQPAWSPDGTQLIFVTPCARKQEWYADGSLYIIDVVGNTPSAPRPFIALIGGEFDPTWGPQGVLFSQLQPGQRPRLFIATGRGENPHALSVGNAVDSQGTWSPDGTRIAFRNTSRSAIGTLYWMNADGTFSGSNPEALTRDRDATYPAWSPDGRYVLFESGGQVWIVEWEAKGFNAAQLSPASSSNFSPIWSTDGQWIVFESGRNQNRDLYRMDFTGAQVTRLTDDAARDYHPAWRP